MNSYPRDMIGYADNPPNAKWPGGACIAMQFVLNYEEGGENCILHGDRASEAFLSDMIGTDQREGVRHMSMESLYEYGSRAGVWRILKLFEHFDIPLTCFAVAMAAERNPKVMEALVAAGHEICSHGYRWIDYQYVSESIEREHMERAIEILKGLTGEAPKGWYTGRTSPNTRRLVVKNGSFVYESDDYSDDLPFWNNQYERPQLIVPYTLEANDMKFAAQMGFVTGDHFFQYLKDTFDVLYAEGQAGQPKMMSVGMHCRILGKPARLAGMKKFLNYIRGFDDVWFARRIDIANHWIKNHPAE